YQAEYDVMNRGIKAQMKYANKIGAKFVLVIGGNELESGCAKLKLMETGEQFEIHLDERFAQEFEDLAIQYMFSDVLEEFEEEK
ncbi:MAG: His/Gly/Thr/Pro-type tRNA ligase C-terminal domain-containing protein, partial [Ruminococcus sp.]